MRPDKEARDEAREVGRAAAPGPTVGGDSLLVETNTPHLGAHVKYLTLYTVLNW